MASLRVFVSSTCYDLSSIRSHLRQFIIGMGHQPIMSEYNDVLYDPRTHTHTSCIEEINNADYIVLIVGGRFGGTVVPDALIKVDFDDLKNKSKGSKIFETKNKSSITQMEIFRAIEKEIPIITFVDSRVMNDHATYEKNKSKEISQHIEYASIEKPHTSSFIFEFINFLRLRSNNNTIHTFSRPEEIENTLRGQWSALLQRLLNDEKTKITDRKGMEDFSTQIEDLKAAILASIGGSKIDKEIAKGIVIYRKFIDFLKGFKLYTYDFLFEENAGSKTLLDYLNISKYIRIGPLGSTNRQKYDIYPYRPLTLFIKPDGTFYLVTNFFDLDDMVSYFNEFVKLPIEGRRIIFDTLNEMYPHNSVLRRNFVYVQDTNIDDFLSSINENKESSDDGDDDDDE